MNLIIIFFQQISYLRFSIVLSSYVIRKSCSCHFHVYVWVNGCSLVFRKMIYFSNLFKPYSYSLRSEICYVEYLFDIKLFDTNQQYLVKRKLHLGHEFDAPLLQQQQVVVKVTFGTVLYAGQIGAFFLSQVLVLVGF